MTLRQIILENLQAELAKARLDVDQNPTEKQKEAGNYRKGHVRIQGMSISIENPKGSYRRGVDKNGKEWKTLMHNDYGYFLSTVGKDGDAIDVFIGPDPDSTTVYAVDQYNGNEFDETKVMLGFHSADEAKSAYLSNYSKDWKGFRYITEVDMPTFKRWLYDGYKQRKPFAKYRSLVHEAKKYNPPRDVAAAVRKGARDADIEDHGRPTVFRKTMTVNGKAYKRRGKYPDSLNEMNAYHGSSAYFSRFDLSKAHTGEGGTMYGYGIYVTTNLDTAKYYLNVAANTNGLKQGFLYQVRIPDDNGRNYLSIEKNGANVYDYIEQGLVKFKPQQQSDIHYCMEYCKQNDTLMWMFQTGCEYSFSEKELATALMQLGYVGIRVPVGYQDAGMGQTEGYNYTIFDDRNVQIQNIQQISLQ